MPRKPAPTHLFTFVRQPGEWPVTWQVSLEEAQELAESARQTGSVPDMITGSAAAHKCIRWWVAKIVERGGMGNP